jgi:DNA (cytosine-5)-methyltransferase 1
MKPVLLDCMCKAGGAGKGYVDAGFEVVGMDIEPQPNYPFEFIEGDVLALDPEWIARWFNAVHASPHCQPFSAYQRTGNVGEYPDQIEETRRLLKDSGLPYVIENVEGAPLTDPVLICGSMFDPPMDIRRHRLFETNWDLEPPVWPCRHKLHGPDRFPGGRSKERTGTSTGLVRGTIEVGSWDVPLTRQKQAMGVDWDVTLPELSNAVPPAFTEFIGTHLQAVQRERSVA